jgi:uncharacterized damage-inducible protein DinB
MRGAGAAVVLAIAAAVTLSAQQQRPASAADHSFSQAVRNAWNSAKRNIVESADQMPEENYSFKPVDSVRTFGQILAHVAGTSYVYCSAAKGEKTPFEEDHFEKAATTKAAIVKAIADSNAYCDEAFNALTDATAGQPVNNPFGSGQSARVSSLLSNTGHLNEHYGNLVTYFRIKGMVPPSSKRQ